MQSVSADITIKDANRAWTDILVRIANGETPDPPSTQSLLLLVKDLSDYST